VDLDAFVGGEYDGADADADADADGPIQLSVSGDPDDLGDDPGDGGALDLEGLLEFNKMF
jgi:hypothetical protein